jgi:hypothetical protein
MRSTVHSHERDQQVGSEDKEFAHEPNRNDEYQGP